MPGFDIRALAERLLTLAIGGRCASCGTTSWDGICPCCEAEIRSTPAVPDAAFHDQGAVSRLVRLAKRGDWRAGGAMLAMLLLATRPQLVPDCDVVTWIPPDPRRRARRGGHLPERFARALAAGLGVPAQPLLQRRPGTRSQRGLGREERRRNVDGSFLLRRGRRCLAVPALRRRVLLVDDVRTTGATLAAARTVLERAGWTVRVLAIVGVDSSAAGSRELRSERGIRAQDSNRRCRCLKAPPAKGSTSLIAPRPP